MTLLKFYTTTCEPCSLLSNILAKEGIKTLNINAKVDTELVTLYSVRTVPTLVHEATGEKLVGLKSIIEIKEWIDKCENKF